MMRQKSARSSFRQPTILQFLLATLFLPGIAAFTTSPYSVCRESLPCSSGRGFLCASNGQNEEPPNEKKKYKFGDITQSLVTRVTKKKNYKFGDLSRALDQSAKNKVAKLRGKDQYEFGDLSKYIDSKVKEQVNDFTKKDLYKFGDITEEIIKRIKNRDYSLEDMIILLKILLAFGAGLTPVAQFLPAKLLIEALDVSIAGDLGNKFIAEITKELDRRMKMAFTGSPDYQLGDLSKKAVLKYIGKDEYAFGDVTKFVMKSVEEKTDNEQKEKNRGGNGSEEVPQAQAAPTTQRSILDDDDGGLIAQELEEWDSRFRNSTNTTSSKL